MPDVCRRDGGRGIEDELPLLSIIKEALRYQGPQMLRNGRDRPPEDLRDITHAALVNAEDMQDGLARGMAQHLVATGGLLKLLIGGKPLLEGRYLPLVEADNRAALKRAFWHDPFVLSFSIMTE